MQAHTYSEDKQKLAIVLEQVKDTEKVFIRRKDRRIFALIQKKKIPSPLEAPSINAKITSDEIVNIVRKGRER